MWLNQILAKTMKKTSLILLSVLFITLSNCKQAKTTQKTEKESSHTTDQITKKRSICFSPISLARRMAMGSRFTILKRGGALCPHS